MEIFISALKECSQREDLVLKIFSDDILISYDYRTDTNRMVVSNFSSLKKVEKIIKEFYDKRNVDFSVEFPQCSLQQDLPKGFHISSENVYGREIVKYN
jgi:hypothetical protein